MNLPEVHLIGAEVALRWADGAESFFTMERLRAASPSAETKGETDIFGRKMGGDDRTEFPGVTVTSFEPVGNYALRFVFSDGHNTGLYSIGYLRELAGLPVR